MLKSAFDKVGLLVVGLAFGFSVGVLIATGEWFTREDRVFIFGTIAEFPTTSLVAFALLLPWLVLLCYIIMRRKKFDDAI